MRPNELVRRTREQLGLTQMEVAQRSGLSTHEYSDIEQHADELMTNVPLSKVRSVCSVLGLDLSSLLAGSDFGPLTADISNDELPRHVLVKKYRESRNASPADVANAIGFEEEAVRRAESDEDYLDTLPLGVLSDWSKYIGLPLVHML